MVEWVKIRNPGVFAMYFDDMVLNQTYTTESVVVKEEKMIAFAK